MSLRWVYMTAGKKEDAIRIGEDLVKSRLAACVNVLDGITSLYWWEGQIQTDSEVALVAKTRAELVDQLVERVKSLHPYSCPCVVSLPIEAGNPDFLAWIRKETERKS